MATRRQHTTVMRDVRTSIGGVMSPFEAWLTLRGVRTLPVRMDRHCANALEMARWLEAQPWIDRVYYPGLTSHPHRERANDLFGGKFGGMMAFDLASDQAGSLRFLDALQLITPGTSLGDVESLVLYPVLSSHRQLDAEGLRSVGIGYGLVRFSVGLESPADLQADLSAAARQAGIAEVAAQPAR
jgi:cystathionine gamma-lyase